MIKRDNDDSKKFLEYYIKEIKEPEYAVLVDGAWGSGKTYNINKIIKNENWENKENFLIINISLFQISTLKELKDAIFQKMLPFFGNKVVKKILNFFKTNLPLMFGYRIKLPDFDFTDLLLSHEYNKENRENVFIFDDIERSKIDLSIFLGYVNYLVEIKKQKVILLSNTKELQEDVFYKYKEKLIGKTVTIHYNFYSAYNHFGDNLSSNDVKDIFRKENVKLIIENVFERAGYGNLRDIKKAFLDFEYLYKKVLEAEGFYKNNKFMESFIEIFFIMSIELNRFDIDENIFINYEDSLENIENENFNKEAYPLNTSEEVKNEVSSDKEKDAIKSIKEKFEKYPFDLSNGILTPNQWVDFLYYGKFNKNELIEAIRNSQYFFLEYQEDWKSLWYYKRLEQEEFDKLIKRVLNKLQSQNNIYKDPLLLAHIISSLFDLLEEKLIDISIENIKELSKKAIDSSIETWAKEDNFNVGILFFNSDNKDALGYKELSFLSKDNNEFINVLDYLLEKYKNEVFNIYAKDSTKIVFELLNQQNLEEFYKFISDDKNIRIPIFSKIDPKEFLNNMIGLKNRYLSRYSFDGFITQIWYYRYPRNWIESEIIQEELSFWEGLKKEIDTLVSLNSNKKDLKMHILSKVSKYELKEFIKSLKERTAHLDNN